MVTRDMSTTSRAYQIARGVDLRLATMAVFLELMAAWHVLEGTLFPDAIFFAVVGVLSLIFAMIGIEAESGFEMGEGESE